MSVVSATQRAVPISLFHQGLADQIFEDVRRQGTKVVVKDDAAECVLLSPEEYNKLMDDYNDAKLLALALERMEHYDPATVISQEEFDRLFGFTEEDLAGWEDVELE